MNKDTTGIDKILVTMSSKEVFNLLCGTLGSRFKTGLTLKLKDIKDELVNKPFGRLYVVYHLWSTKLFGYLYKKGIVKKPQDTLELEFDRKSKICLSIFNKDLLKISTVREDGNTCFWAVQDGAPIFTAVGAYAYKDWINKHEFQLDAFPYANGFVGGSSVNVHWLRGQMQSFDKEVGDLFIKAMDIDSNWTSKNNKAFYSKGLIDLSDFFKTYMFANKEMTFFLGRFLTSYMRLVYLEQRKMDVSLAHIVALKKKWEQDLVHEFVLGVFIIGVNNYAFVFKCLPLNIQKRVPNFHARRSYEKADKYKSPISLFQSRKHS
jgi:hypothetical protein